MSAVQPLTFPTSHATSGNEERPLSGAMFGQARRITQACGRAALSGKALNFCFMLLDETFGNAKWHRNDGGVEHECAFDLAAWASALGWYKPDVLRVRGQLVEQQMIVYAPDAQKPGRGRISWNLNTEEWLPLQAGYRSARYHASVSRTTNDTPVSETTNETAADVSATTNTGVEALVKPLTESADALVKPLTPPRAEARASAASATSLKRVTKKGNAKTNDQDAPARVATPAPSAVSPASQPSQPVDDDTPAEHARTLETLHNIPRWQRADPKREQEVLDELCAVTVGGVGQMFHPAFVAKRAGDYSDWMRATPPHTSQPRYASSQPSLKGFRSFMGKTKPEEYATWQRDRRHAATVVARGATSSRDPLHETDVAALRRSRIMRASTVEAQLAARAASDDAALAAMGFVPITAQRRVAPRATTPAPAPAPASQPHTTHTSA